MKLNNITTGVNGELHVGDTVVSINDGDYSYLVGTILSINLVGSHEHKMETENETDDVHVEFNGADYSKKRICEIEAGFTDLYGEEKTFDDCGLDDVIMSPDMLIRADAFTEDDMAAILECEEKAAIVCERILITLRKEGH
jgi:hypothetical protein